MPLYIVRNDITKMAVDAIVNPTNERMHPDGGVDAAIHKAAGSGLTSEHLRSLRPGHVVLTGAYDLPCKYIIHTVGPRWYDGLRSEESILRRCYQEALKLAKAKGCESIAFPLVSAGNFGFPVEKALRIASSEIRQFLEREELTVYLVVYDRTSYRLGQSLFPEIQAYIDDGYVEDRQKTEPRQNRPGLSGRGFGSILPQFDSMDFGAPSCPPPAEAPRRREEASPRRMSAPAPKAAARPAEAQYSDLNEMLRRMDEGFSEMLFRLIDEKGLTDAQCYKRANIDRKLFSKIRNPKYKPSKPTVLALAIALELPLSETDSLLRKAGFALSHSSKFDMIVEYCIVKRIYNIHDVNEILFFYDQTLLGSGG